MSNGAAARSLPSVGSSSSFPHSSVVGAASPTAAGDGGRDGGSRRLLIVANRLPVSMSIKQQTVGRGGTGGKSDISFASSAGGLVSALAGTDMESFWIGWPGGEVKGKEDRATVVEKLKALGCVPVFLSTELCDLFYNGFCNDLLWPLFHYIPLPIDAIKAHDKQFQAYQKANAEFAKVVLDAYEEGDVVWVHDYHLMLLPSLLRQARPAMKVGFFFHTPFPSSEIYRVIPSRAELLYGVLSSNLLGFHTHDYSRHFQSAATRIIGAQCSNEQITLNGAVSQLGTFPIGIDPRRFVDALATDKVKGHLEEFRRQFSGKRVLLGIDRLDYIKGIAQKLHALELFFERNPAFVGEVVLVQIAIPSRTDVVEYQRLKTSMHELVGRINGRFGSVASVPIHYLDQSIPFDRMCALYRLADAMVITSIRDGMNLVAYEYIACQDGRNGMLILSEFAGAAQSLGAGALQVNPWNISEVADAIHKALTMKEVERQERTRYCFSHVMAHTAKAWAREFVEALETLPVGANDSGASLSASSASLSSLGSPNEAANNQLKTQLPSPLDVDGLLAAFHHSKHRLIITGLAGIVSRAALGQKGADGWAEEGTTHIRSQYEENAGEMWGWQQDADAEAQSGAAQSQSTATPPQSTVLPSSGRIIRGPSRYASHTRRVSSFAKLPSQAKDEEHAMEEWMDMDDDAEHAALGEAGAPGEDGEREGQGLAKEPSAEELRAAIIALASDANTTYLLLTSRTRDWCDSLFASLPQLPANLWFAAENGYFFKSATFTRQGAAKSASPDWHVMYENVDFGWMEGVHRVMTYFCERTPRSYIQVQETSMQWHYGDAEPTFAKRQALDLISHLTGGPLSNTATEVVNSANIVQVRPLAVSKGRALKHLLAYLHKRYRSRQRRSVRRSDVLSSDSEDGAGRGEGGEEQAASGTARPAPSDGATTSSPLNSAAIQSALVESGFLVAREGESGGYEEDDEGGEEPAGKGKPRPTASAGGHHSSRSIGGGGGIRSRRPSLADPADFSSDGGSQGEGGQGRGTGGAPLTVVPAASPANSSQTPPSPYVPLDFICCIGNFLERDEDIFPLLNEWADHGSIPAALYSGHGAINAGAGGAHAGTPGFHARRLTLSSLSAASPGGPSANSGSASQPIHSSLHPSNAAAANRKASTAELTSSASGPTQPLQSPLSATVSDMGSPTSDSSQALSSSLAPGSGPSIFTVTVGQKPSNARYQLPNLPSVNSLILALSHQLGASSAASQAHKEAEAGGAAGAHKAQESTIHS